MLRELVIALLRWFKSMEGNQAEDKAAEEEVDDEVIKRLMEFKGESNFKRAALNMLVQMTKEDEFKGLKKQF